MRSLLALMVAALCAWPCLPAQDAPVICRACGNRGAIDCNKHGKQLELERGVQFCSVLAECKACAGTTLVDCKTCRNVPAEDKLAERRRLAAELLQKRRADNDAITNNVPLMHLVTGHVDLVFSIRPHTIGKDKLDTHAMMHLYGTRLEAMRSKFLELFEVDAAKVPGRLRIYMFRDEQDQKNMAPRVTGIGTGGAVAATGVKLCGTECVYSMWQDPRSIPDDDALHRTLAHNVAHLLLSNLEPANWLGNKKHGWLDEGLAHWFEDFYTGRCSTWCFEEVLLQPGTQFKGGRWRAPVRKMVDEGKSKPFAELGDLLGDEMTFADHAVAFAYVDFLLARKGGAALRDLAVMIKSDKPTREALQQVYGLNPLTIEPEFQAWVKANYSPIEPK